MMDPKNVNAKDLALHMTRRHFFRRSTAGVALGIPALASLLAGDGFAAAPALDPKTGGLVGMPNFAPKAKRVIYLHQSGAPSQIDLFDPKPNLAKWRGVDLPDSVRQGQRITGMTSGQIDSAGGPVHLQVRSGRQIGHPAERTAAPPRQDRRRHHHHQDSLYRAINHDPAITFIQTGFQQPGRPSMGAWVSYGLGSENHNLPAFVVMISQANALNPDQPLFSRLWGSGFLPSRYQGVKFRAGGDPVLYLSNPPGIEPATRRAHAGWRRQTESLHCRRSIGDPEIDTRIAQYEMAYRMQTSVPDLMDLSKEPQPRFDLYGPDARKPGTFAANCLLARRLLGTRRALRAALPSRLGPARRPAARPRPAVQGHRPGLGGAGHRPQAARLARRHAGDLGRRIRPHGLLPGQAHRRPTTAATTTRAASPCGWPAAASSQALPSAKPTTTATTSSQTRSTSTICRPRSCTAWASTTKLTYKFQGRDFRLTDVAGYVVDKALA